MHDVLTPLTCIVMQHMVAQTRSHALRVAGTSDDKVEEYGPPASTAAAQEELKKRLQFQSQFFDKLDSVIA